MEIFYLYVLGLILFFLLLFIIAEFNSIRRLSNKVKQSKSGIDVALTKRFDLIPNLIECVKGYMTYEEKVLQSLTEQRKSYESTKSFADGEKTNKDVNHILALAEKYPNLKSNEQFLKLQEQLEKLETQIAAARRLYNSDVTMYNTKIAVFPSSIIAKMMRAKKQDLYDAEDEAKNKQDINF